MPTVRWIENGDEFASLYATLTEAGYAVDDLFFADPADLVEFAGGWAEEYEVAA